MKRARSRPAGSGFTLMEVLVAISLVLLLFGSMFMFLNDIAASRQHVDEFAGSQRAAAAFIDRVEADLMSTLVGDRVFGPGVKGSGDRLSVLTRGVGGAAGGAGVGGVPRATGAGELLRSDYHFDAANRTIEARITTASRTQPADTSDRTASDAARRSAARPDASVVAANAGRSEEQESAPHALSPLGRPIAAVRLRYHDGSGWRDRFDSLEAGRLPAAVEVAIWFRAGDAAALGTGRTAEASAADSSSPPRRPVARADRRQGGFDEEAYARWSDLQDGREPAPDRRRVIVIPDAAPDAGSG